MFLQRMLGQCSLSVMNERWCLWCNLYDKKSTVLLPNKHYHRLIETRTWCAITATHMDDNFKSVIKHCTSDMKTTNPLQDYSSFTHVSQNVIPTFMYRNIAFLGIGICHTKIDILQAPQYRCFSLDLWLLYIPTANKGKNLLMLSMETPSKYQFQQHILPQQWVPHTNGFPKGSHHLVPVRQSFSSSLGSDYHMTNWHPSAVWCVLCHGHTQLDVL